MLLLLLVPERSIARKTCPLNPPGFIVSPKPISPPRLTFVLWSKLGIDPASFALVERTHQIWPVFRLTPPTKRLPFVSTSRVPQDGSLGILTGFIQVKPPSIERVNCRPPKLLPLLLQHWYWKPCPMLLVLSIVNHCLSPPFAGAMFVHVWPPS